MEALNGGHRVSKPPRTNGVQRATAKPRRRRKAVSPRQGPAIAVVDDDRSVCDAMSETLRSVGCRPTCFTSPARFLDEGDPDRFACLVLDVRMPGMSGLEVQQELNRRSATLPVIFISGHGDIAMAMAAVRAGALQFLEKPFRDQALLDAVHEAIEAGIRRRADRATRDRLRAKVEGLSPRERQVAENVATGQSAGDIARRLDLSPRTVEMHKLRAMRRLGVSTSTELTRLIVEAQAAGIARMPVRRR
jgi:FixJ family two-component response regulator